MGTVTGAPPGHCHTAAAGVAAFGLPGGDAENVTSLLSTFVRSRSRNLSTLGIALRLLPYGVCVGHISGNVECPSGYDYRRALVLC
jgi:hypothetical protein